jgi:hypothetical protein
MAAFANRLDDPDYFTPWRATKFYVPMLIQAFSQSLTYPLVASIVSHGKAGVLGLAAFAQGQAVLFMIGALGGGLITTGMIFCKDQVGLRQYKRLNLLMCVVLMAVLFLMGWPPCEGFVFHNMLGLTAPMDKIARDTMMWCIPMQIIFFLRNVPLVILYNAKKSAQANFATLCRIGMTAAQTPLFVKLGWVGPMWGVAAISLPCLLELLLAQWMAREDTRRLGPDATQEASMKTQFAFTMPLSFGGFLLAAAGFMIAAFISRAAEPERMLAIHYVTIGLGNPVGFAALRIQAVVLAFPPRWEHDRAGFWYALGSGVALAAIPFIFQIPAAARWYFGTVQNVPAGDIPLAMKALLLFSLLPVLQSLRGQAEGTAAWLRRPNAILAGQAANLASLVCTLFFTLRCGMPGYLMGVTAILVAVMVTWGTVHLGLLCAQMEDKFGRPRLQPPPAKGDNF